MRRFLVLAGACGLAATSVALCGEAEPGPMSVGMLLSVTLAMELASAWILDMAGRIAACAPRAKRGMRRGSG